MIFGTPGTQFSSKVCVSGVVYVRRRCHRQPWNWASCMIFVSRDLVFINSLKASDSLCTLKISALAVELGFEDDFWDTRASVFVKGLCVRSSLCAQKMSSSAVELGFVHDFCVPGT